MWVSVTSTRADVFLARRRTSYWNRPSAPKSGSGVPSGSRHHSAARVVGSADSPSRRPPRCGRRAAAAMLVSLVGGEAVVVHERRRRPSRTSASTLPSMDPASCTVAHRSCPPLPDDPAVDDRAVHRPARARPGRSQNSSLKRREQQHAPVWKSVSNVPGSWPIIGSISAHPVRSRPHRSSLRFMPTSYHSPPKPLRWDKAALWFLSRRRGFDGVLCKHAHCDDIGRPFSS